MSNRKSTDTFIQEAIAVHGDRYQYHLVDYVRNSNKIIIVCSIHGEFLQVPSSHLHGHGCKLCSEDINRKTSEQFIEEANKIHNFKYDYSLLNYIQNEIKVTIICPTHGEFKQTPHLHLIGKGCGKCSPNANKGLDQFIIDANRIHNNKYDYSESIYINKRTKLKIICFKHGEFYQAPQNHITGKTGCPQCVSTISNMETEWLNTWGISREFRNISIPGIGRLRVDGYSPPTNTVYEFHGDYWHGNPKIYDSEKYNDVSGFTFGELYQKTISKENLIKSLGYNLVVIWESDYKNKKKAS